MTPVYVFMSMLAALAVMTLWNREQHRTVARAAVILLLSWMTVSSALAHPDYLAYFNEFGGKGPSRLLVIGDLDWGAGHDPSGHLSARKTNQPHQYCLRRIL